MGRVYRARDTRLDRDVAIKVLGAEYSKDDDRLRRFTTEAKTTGALNHPNVLAIYDVSTATIDEQTLPYLVCELLEGETLRTRLGGGRLPLSKAIDIARQVASGLAAAHAKGITHRDITDLGADVAFGTRISPGLRFTLADDGKSFLASIMRTQTDLWILEHFIPTR